MLFTQKWKQQYFSLGSSIFHLLFSTLPSLTSIPFSWASQIQRELHCWNSGEGNHAFLHSVSFEVQPYSMTHMKTSPASYQVEPALHFPPPRGNVSSIPKSSHMKQHPSEAQPVSSSSRRTPGGIPAYSMSQQLWGKHFHTWTKQQIRGSIMFSAGSYAQRGSSSSLPTHPPASAFHAAPTCRTPPWGSCPVPECSWQGGWGNTRGAWHLNLGLSNVFWLSLSYAFHVWIMKHCVPGSRRPGKIPGISIYPSHPHSWEQ